MLEIVAEWWVEQRVRIDVDGGFWGWGYQWPLVAHAVRFGADMDSTIQPDTKTRAGFYSRRSVVTRTGMGRALRRGFWGGKGVDHC